MASSTDLLLTATLLLALVCVGSAFKCYVCETSIHNDSCADPYGDHHLEDCKDEDFIMCYKQVTVRYQVGSSGNVEKQNTYYSRFCGHRDNSRKECKVIEGSNVMTTQCGCDDEGCNAAPGLPVSMTTLICSAFLALSTSIAL